MAPQRRSSRLKRKRVPSAAEVEEEKLSTRQKKRREIRSPPSTPVVESPSAAKALPAKVSDVWSDDGVLQLNATTQLLYVVSVEDEPLIDQVIQAGVVPRLVEFLERDDYPQLQREAACVLKNMTSGTSDNIKMVMDCGAVPVLVKLLKSSEIEILEQATWALGNIAGDSPMCRDVVLKSGALHPLLTLLNDHNELSFRKIGTWTLANLFEGKPKVPIRKLEHAIQVLASLILMDDEEVLKEVCWALLYISRCGRGIETTMMEAGICCRLGKLFREAPPSVLLPAIRVFTSIANEVECLDKPALKMVPHAGYLVTADVAKCIKDEAYELHCLIVEHIFSADRLRWKETEPFGIKMSC